MAEIEISTEIVPGKGKKGEDTYLKLFENSDCTKEASRKNPYFMIQIAQGLNVCEITFNAYQKRMAEQTFEYLRCLDEEAIFLDQYTVEDEG